MYHIAMITFQIPHSFIYLSLLCDIFRFASLLVSEHLGKMKLYEFGKVGGPLSSGSHNL